jgi:5,10-methylenetetrahydrofolate reductase
MGAPEGNQNAAKGKRWAAAVERALARQVTKAPAPTDVSDLMRGIDAAADLFVAQMFADKDLGYFKELGDRLEGKAIQQTELSGPEGEPLSVKTIVNFVSGS